MVFFQILKHKLKSLHYQDDFDIYWKVFFVWFRIAVASFVFNKQCFIEFYFSFFKVLSLVKCLVNSLLNGVRLKYFLWHTVDLHILGACNISWRIWWKPVLSSWLSIRETFLLSQNFDRTLPWMWSTKQLVFHMIMREKGMLLSSSTFKHKRVVCFCLRFWLGFRNFSIMKW